MKKSWHLDRRTFLRGAGGLTLGLPFMNAMASAGESKALSELPKRSMFIFFPNGASMPPSDHLDHDDWFWFPKGSGEDYELRENMEDLVPYRDELSFISGLSNPKNRTMRPHVGPSGFLTTQQIGGKLPNTISIDQEIVSQLDLGRVTPVESLVMSTIGGTGNLGRSRTLSFDQRGNPIPAMSSLKDIYKKMYQSTSAQHIDSLKTKKTLLDAMLADARDLSRNLGVEDTKRLDEYLASIRDVEKRIEHQLFWSEKLKANEKDAPKVNLDISFEDVEEYIQTLYDLVAISFETDLTRVATYQIAPEDASSVVNLSKYIGLPFDLHALSHAYNKSIDGYKDWALWDQFVARQLAYLLKRLKDTKEGDSTLLDRTLIFQGSATGKSHDNRNYPLLLAGGKKMGHKGGRFITYNEQDNALSNLYVRIANSMGAPIAKFGDSTDISMTELFH